MKTQHRQTLIDRMNEEKKRWKAIVIARIENVDVETLFNSHQDTLENVLHCIELNIMTSLHHGIKQPVSVIIEEVKDE